VLRLRQGFGRLIRRKDDTGVVVLLDSRAIKTNYGKVFLRALPAPVKRAYSLEELARLANTNF
jgi:Rad3-related DNA helicase